MTQYNPGSIEGVWKNKPIYHTYNSIEASTVPKNHNFLQLHIDLHKLNDMN